MLLRLNKFYVGIMSLFLEDIILFKPVLQVYIPIYMSDTSTKKKEVQSTKATDVYTLVLWNDDENSFDDVIDALIDICKHNELQAEQCATIAHYKGKCRVRSGETFSTLSKLKRLFDARQINTSIE